MHAHPSTTNSVCTHITEWEGRGVPSNGGGGGVPGLWPTQATPAPRGPFPGLPIALGQGRGLHWETQGGLDKVISSSYLWEAVGWVLGGGGGSLFSTLTSPNISSPYFFFPPHLSVSSGCECFGVSVSCSCFAPASGPAASHLCVSPQ